MYKLKSHHNFQTTIFKAVKLCHFCRLCCPLSCSSVLPWATSTLFNSKMSMDEFDSLQPCMQSPIYTSTSPGLASSSEALPYPCDVLVRNLIPVGLWGLFPLSFVCLTLPLLPGYIYIFQTLYWLWYCCIFFNANIQYSNSFYVSSFREQFWWSRFNPPPVCISMCSSCLQVINCFQWC